MTVTSLIRAVIFPDSDKPAAAVTALAPGDLLDGRVLEIAGNGKLLIDFGNLRVLADTDLTFHPGEKIRVRVEETGKQIKLKHLIVSQPEAIAAGRMPDAAGSPLDRIFAPFLAAIDRAVPADKGDDGAGRLPEAVRQALTSIQTTLQPSLASLHPADIAMLLKHLVENAGFFFEKRLGSLLEQPTGSAPDRSLASEAELRHIRRVFDRDLKSNLAVLKHHLDDPSVRSLSALSNADDLKSAADRLFSGIQRQQLQFRSHLSDSDPPPAFTVPFHLIKTRQKGLLKVFAGSRSKNAKSDGIRISVILHMDKIGEIQSDLLLLDKALHVTFHVGDEAVKDQLQKQVERFTSAVADQFASVRIEVRLHPHLRQEMEMQAAQIFSDRLIDVRV